MSSVATASAEVEVRRSSVTTFIAPRQTRKMGELAAMSTGSAVAAARSHDL
jgi:hypothetical protein